MLDGQMSSADMHRLRRIANCVALLSVLCACHRSQSQAISSSEVRAGPEARWREVLAQSLPPLNGDRIKSTVLEITYPPGGSSRPHRHPCPVIGYVIAGALRTAVNSAPEMIVHAGETFYEPPNGTHRVSANASNRDAVRFLAIFLCDNDQPLSAAVTSSGN